MQADSFPSQVDGRLGSESAVTCVATCFLVGLGDAIRVLCMRAFCSNHSAVECQGEVVWLFFLGNVIN